MRSLGIHVVSVMLALSVSRAAAQTVHVSCRFDTPQLVVASDGYVRIAMSGCSTLQQHGQPQMPFQTVRLPLPPQARVTGIAVRISAAPVVLDLAGPLDFGRTPLPTRRGAASARAARDAPDPAVYRSTRRYPAQQVELVSVQCAAGNDFAMLRVFPLQYEPVAGRLVFTPALELAVALDVPAAAPEHPLRRAASNATGYLLVTSANLLAAFQPLLDFHAANGLAVRAETMENIVSNVAGRDAAEKLRNYIGAGYASGTVHYVLLGGDIGVVPCRGVYASCSGKTLGDMPSDLYYACLDGSWNSDNDGVWGEPNDGNGGGDVDLLAEVLVGRAPVETVTEVDRFVDKTIRFSTASRLRFNALFAGEYLGVANGAQAQGGDALDRELPAFTNAQRVVSWLDDRPNNAETWSFFDARAALNLAPPLVAHYGHADEATLMRMGAADLDALSNTCPFLLYSTGCDAGWFDNQFPPDCIGEELVARNSRAAFAAMVNTREGWFDGQQEWRYSGEYQQRFFDGLLGEERATIGAAHQLAKQDLIGNVETNGNMPYRWCYFGITLLGDPGAHVAWIAPPFVDITNGTMQAMITAPFAIAGTNNNAVVGLMWVSNAANGQRLYFPASQSWSAAALNLELDINTIYVFGSNSVGTVTNDTVIVIGMPEGMQLGVRMLAISLIMRKRVPPARPGGVTS